MIRQLIHKLNTILEASKQESIPTIKNPLKVGLEKNGLALKDLALSKLLFPIFYWDGTNKNSRHFLALGKMEKDPTCLVGGIPFYQDQSKTEASWSPFRETSLYTPQIIIEETDSQFVFTFHTPQTLTLNDSHQDNFRISNEEFTPRFHQWNEMIRRSCKEIQERQYKKIVLSRYAKYQYCGDIFGHLHKNFNKQENSYNFIWAIDSEHVFISQSPETLFKTEQQKIYVDSLAGTIERGKTTEEDLVKREILRHDPKELEEHRFVTSFLEGRLEQLCDDVQMKQSEQITVLEHIQHLHTKLLGTLDQNVSVLNILHTLHPTPAIGGLPQQGIQKKIYDKENFDRGFYSAPIGFITPTQSEFLVGIRSALLVAGVARIYAGAGIVQNSQAEKEWEETAQKMKTMRGLL